MKKSKNIVFIARSLDGYIAGANGEIDWLESIPNPDQIDMGYGALIDEIDAIVMGRKTYETVLSFGIEWPYTKHVFVLSNSIHTIPEDLSDRVTLLSGEVDSILDDIHSRGFHTLHIDGGSTIQAFLQADRIDEMILTTIPILLGGGFPLFGNLTSRLAFEHVESIVFLNQIVQDKYRRKQ